MHRPLQINAPFIRNSITNAFSNYVVSVLLWLFRVIIRKFAIHDDDLDVLVSIYIM